MILEDSQVEYAVWTSAASPLPIKYSRPLFQEIDLTVNEGYRSIPHGGVEVGGILFGAIEESIRIDAFRTIACEHASGPSFILSDRDIAKLKEQFAAAKSDSDLQELEPVGWFIAHTRSPLEMKDQEVSLFDELFPGTGRVTLLVKPERFQATRFGFVVRDKQGRIERNASEHAFILPLPGRAAAEPIRVPSPASPLPTGPSERIPDQGEAAGRVLQPESPFPFSVPAGHAQPPDAPAEVEKAAVQPDRENSRSFDKAAFTEELLKRFEAEPAVEPPRRAPPIANADIWTPEPEMQERATGSHELRADNTGSEVQPAPRRTLSYLRLAFGLIVSVVLGWVLGYIAYLHITPGVIRLSVESRAEGFLLEWPPQQTQDASYAAVRINDGQPVPLSAEAKALGRTEIKTTNDNVKVELIVQSRIRTSHGVIRFIRPGAQSQTSAAPSTLESHSASASQ